MYRPHLWHNCVPKEQRFMVLTTYGPQSEGPYDIDSDVVGFEPFGSFETIQEAEQQIQVVREMNPHAVFIPMHTLDVGNGKRVQLPPPNDGSCQTFHLNKQHHAIMAKHMKKEVEDVEYIEDRVKDSIDDVKEKNKKVRQYNAKIQKHAMAILGMNKEEISEKRNRCKESVRNKLMPMKDDEALIVMSTNPGKMSLVSQIDTGKDAIKSLTFDQVEDFVSAQQDSDDIPKGYRVIYKRYMNAEGKEYLVRCMQYLDVKDGTN